MTKFANTSQPFALATSSEYTQRVYQANRTSTLNANCQHLGVQLGENLKEALYYRVCQLSVLGKKNQKALYRLKVHTVVHNMNFISTA